MASAPISIFCAISPLLFTRTISMHSFLDCASCSSLVVQPAEEDLCGRNILEIDVSLILQ